MLRPAAGDATVFTGKLRAGSYLGVQMVTIGRDGFPEPFDQEERTPMLEVPEVEGPEYQSWFGPLPKTRDYQIIFVTQGFIW